MTHPELRIREKGNIRTYELMDSKGRKYVAILEVSIIGDDMYPDYRHAYRADTLEAHQHKGYYTALTKKALEDAKYAGFKGLIYRPHFPSFRNPENTGYRSELNNNIILPKWYERHDMWKEESDKEGYPIYFLHQFKN